mgnify:CR=1 FL=1
MILYGSIANISIGKLFIAGIGPGVLLCVAMMILVHFISKKRGYKPMRTERLTMKQAAPEIASAFLPAATAAESPAGPPPMIATSHLISYILLSPFYLIFPETI